MAEERDIEKQLRAAAEQRRREAGAPFELHPATRRLLQDEVRRVHPRSSRPAEKNSFFSNWWFRIAAGACVVILAAAIFLPTLSSSKSRGLRYARNLELREKANTGPASPLPESASIPGAAPPSRGDSDKDQPVLTREIASKEARAKSLAVNVTNGIVTGMAPGGSTLAFDSHFIQPKVYFRNAGLPADTSWTAGGQVANKPAESDSKLSFDDLAKTAAGKSPFAVFQMEQTGNQIRITDSDGSVYNGTMIVAPMETPAIPAEATAAAAAMTAKEPEKQLDQPGHRNELLSINNPALPLTRNFGFNAVGTNLSLNQKITISGEFIVATNQANFEGAARNGGMNGGEGGGPVPQSTASNSQLLSGGHITGKAILANGQEILLNAASTAP